MLCNLGMNDLGKLLAEETSQPATRRQEVGITCHLFLPQKSYQKIKVNQVPENLTANLYISNYMHYLQKAAHETSWNCAYKDSQK